MPKNGIDFEVLERFHSQVTAPDIRGIIREEIAEQIGALRDELGAFRTDLGEHVAFAHRNAVRLECQGDTIKTALGRLENRISVLEKKLS